MADTEYEYSQPFTFGCATSSPGPTASLKSPFPQDSECAILSVSFGAAGFAFVSPQSGTTSIATTSALGGQQGMVFQGSTNNLQIAPDAIFWKMDQDQTVYLTAAGTSTSTVLVTVVFRRHRGFERGMDEPVEVDPYAYEDNEANRLADYLSHESQRERRGRVER